MRYPQSILFAALLAATAAWAQSEQAAPAGDAAGVVDESREGVADKAADEPSGDGVDGVAAEAGAAETAQGDEGGQDSLVQEGAAPAGASLKILSAPAEAVVVLDKEVVGKTPLQLDNVAPGEHAIEIRKKGHFLKKASVTVAAGDEKELSFELTRPATLVVTSAPSGATVSVNGDSSGVTPYRNGKLMPAAYQVSVAARGYQTAARNVSLENKESDSLHVVLEAAKAVEKPAAARERTGRLGLVDKIALGVFLAFSVLVLTIELAGTRE